MSRSNFEEEADEEPSSHFYAQEESEVDLLRAKQDSFLRRWKDWNWEMTFDEFCEALVRCAETKFKERHADLSKKASSLMKRVIRSN